MSEQKSILLAGASRGLGLGLVREYLGRGWHVVATARDPDAADGLIALSTQPGGVRLAIEALDVVDQTSVVSLAERMAGRAFDVLFVVAGVSGHSNAPIHAVPSHAVAHEFTTNATSPLVVAEALRPSLVPGATVAFMTSLLGSIASNAGGGMELYRATKAALNMLASCYALRHRDTPVVLMHPGWVRTELGGANAPVDVATSARGMARVLDAHAGKPGLSYVDYQDKKLPW